MLFAQAGWLRPQHTHSAGGASAPATHAFCMLLPAHNRLKPLTCWCHLFLQKAEAKAWGPKGIDDAISSLKLTCVCDANCSLLSRCEY